MALYTLACAFAAEIAYLLAARLVRTRAGIGRGLAGHAAAAE